MKKHLPTKKQEKRSSAKLNNHAYHLIIRNRAVKQLAEIPRKFAEKIDELIQSLVSNPRPAGCKKLQGYDNVYRVRYADYRVVYSIEDQELVIEIIQIGNRKEIYNKLI